MFVPALTIVTIVKDDLLGFGETLLSVSNQVVKCRHLVIDGSYDDDVRREIIRRCADVNSEYIYQQPNGIYPAMNAALLRCSDSEYVMFLNAGDRFIGEDSAKEILEKLRTSRNVLHLFPSVFGERNGFCPNIEGANVSRVARGRVSICHQGVVASVRLIRDCGCFDESYRISADHKLLLQMLSRMPASVHSTPVALVALGGVSDFKCHDLAFENARARKETATMMRPEVCDLAFTRYRVLRCRTKHLLRKVSRLVGVSETFPQRLLHGRK
jgi:hypothetical protein